jgi:hypothetical protein
MTYKDLYVFYFNDIMLPYWRMRNLHFFVCRNILTGVQKLYLKISLSEI